MTALFSQAIPAVMQVPQIAPLLGNIIKYANSQFRAGREMEQTLEEFTDQMKQTAAQPKPDPAAEAAKQQAEMLKAKTDAELKALEAKTQAELTALDAKTKAELALKGQEHATKADYNQRDMAAKAQEHAFKLQSMKLERDNRQLAHDHSMQAGKAQSDQNLAAAQQKAENVANSKNDPQVDDDTELLTGLVTIGEATAKALEAVADGQKMIAGGLTEVAKASTSPVTG
jgi:outer membrane receptor for ferrienterochelin and colicin